MSKIERRTRSEEFYQLLFEINGLAIVVNYTSSFKREGLTNYWQSLVK